MLFQSIETVASGALAEIISNASVTSKEIPVIAKAVVVSLVIVIVFLAAAMIVEYYPPQLS